MPLSNTYKDYVIQAIELGVPIYKKGYKWSKGKKVPKKFYKSKSELAHDIYLFRQTDN